MGTLLLGILCRNSWQTQLHLLKTMFLTVPPKNIWWWCWKFATLVLVSFRLQVKMVMCIPASEACSDCIRLLVSAEEIGLLYLLLDRDQKKPKIQQVTCTSMKRTPCPAYSTKTNCLKAQECNKFSSQCINIRVGSFKLSTLKNITLLFQVFRTFAELSLWLFKKCPGW